MIKKPREYRKVLLWRLAGVEAIVEEALGTAPRPAMLKHMLAGRAGAVEHRGRLKAMGVSISDLQAARSFLDGWFKGLSAACGFETKQHPAGKSRTTTGTRRKK